jgi:hypothetical protein
MQAFYPRPLPAPKSRPILALPVTSRPAPSSAIRVRLQPPAARPTRLQVFLCAKVPKQTKNPKTLKPGPTRLQVFLGALVPKPKTLKPWNPDPCARRCSWVR